VYAVLGDPVAHSQTPRVFNHVFRELGLNACAVKVRLDDAARMRDVLDALEIRGASVTIPHKEAALAVADEPDERAKGIGAANTLVCRDGRIRAFNTDVLGATESLQEAARRKWSHGVYGMRTLVLGAGGTARAVAWGLLREGARVTIANRTFERGKALAEALRCDALAWGRLIEARAQIVVNATRVAVFLSRLGFAHHVVGRGIPTEVLKQFYRTL
jgi:shikimate dehydrogenase